MEAGRRNLLYAGRLPCDLQSATQPADFSRHGRNRPKSPTEAAPRQNPRANSSPFPDSPFQLFQPYPPAGDQPEAIDKLVEGMQRRPGFQTLLGVTGSGKTYTMANVIARMGRPAIVFAPNKTLAAQLYSEFREFFPKNAVEYFVSYYDYYQPEAYVPQRDLFIEKDSVDQRAHRADAAVGDQERAGAARRGDRRHRVSAIYGIGDPEDYTQMRFIMRVGDKIGQRDVIAQLIRMQYNAQRAATSRAARSACAATRSTSSRPSTRELAIRIELFDDEVESLQLFDPLTGRIRQKMPRFTVYPSQPLRDAARAGRVGAIETIKEELRERLDVASSRDGKLVEAQRLEQRTRFDLEMLQEIGHCKGTTSGTSRQHIRRRWIPRAARYGLEGLRLLRRCRTSVASISGKYSERRRRRRMCCREVPR